MYNHDVGNYTRLRESWASKLSLLHSYADKKNNSNLSTYFDGGILRISAIIVLNLIEEVSISHFVDIKHNLI